VAYPSTTVLDRPVSPDDNLSLDDDFALDVRVVVTYASASRGSCPTDDGCGNTCATNDSSCGSSFEIPL
jgi:FxLD family lantipeptide